MMSWPVVEPVDKKRTEQNTLSLLLGEKQHLINIGLLQCVWWQEEVRVLRHFLNDRLNTQLPITTGAKAQSPQQEHPLGST